MTLFAEKIDSLAESVAATAAAVDPSWGQLLQNGSRRTAIAVGSGGSAITANFFAGCRRTLGYPATHIVTPLELVLSGKSTLDGPVWFFSGSGDNADIAAAFDYAASAPSRDLVVVTSRARGSLAVKAASIDVPVLLAPTASHKDGFLATHTLMSAITGLLLASEIVANKSSYGLQSANRLAESLRTLAHPERREKLTQTFKELTSETVLLLLHDPRLAAAAVAIETSAWEVSLCPVQRADFRNFSHGRHVLPAKRPNQVFALALTGFETRAMWQEIECHLDPSVRRFALDFADCGRHQNATSIATALTLVEAFGNVTGIDPANPGVGDGGRQLFQSTILTAIADQLSPPVRTKTAAIQRYDHADAARTSVSACHADYRSVVLQSDVCGLVVDYDGTLVPTDKRNDPVRQDLAALLNLRLDQGLKLAIATGRGASVVQNLRGAIEPRHRASVIVGYYNGAILRRLSEEPAIDLIEHHPDIEAVYTWLVASRHVVADTIRRSPVQLTLPRGAVSDVGAFTSALRSAGHSKVKIALSGHSIDVCLVSSRKTNVIDAMGAAWGLEATTILSAGDSGSPSGNDYELLGRQSAVAIGELCGRPSVGWPLFGPDVSGPEAVYRLLQALHPVPGTARFKLCPT